LDALCRVEEEAQRKKQEEFDKEAAGASGTDPLRPLGSLGKPLKTCIGCGKRAAEMLKCSKCRLVFACSNVCFSSGMHTISMCAEGLARKSGNAFLV
jgi:hypothetical protein